MKRWWIYQRERFPLMAHGPLIAVFSFSAVSFSGLLRGAPDWPSFPVAATAFVCCLISFLHLRIADEFKDIDEDTRYRPYRPVPRGLVSLRELGWVWVVTAIVQVVLAWALDPRLVLVLLITWIYLALMCREFFAREWLKARPFTYLWSHMLILPLVDLFATACDWIPTEGSPPAGIYLFVIVSFFNGVVIELGRKIRAPETEEEGVPTYTALWGRNRAVLCWIVALFLTMMTGSMAASLVGFAPQAMVIWAVFAIGAGFLVIRFLRKPVGTHAKPIETFSGIWTLALYLTLGVLPRLIS